MKNIKVLDHKQIAFAENYFNNLSKERNKNNVRTYHKYDEKKGRKRTSDRTKKIETLSELKKFELKQKEELTLTEISIVYQNAVKCSYQKLHKKLTLHPLILSYMYTKGWISFKHTKQTKKRDVQTRIKVKQKYILDFLCFYKRVLR